MFGVRRQRHREYVNSLEGRALSRPHPRTTRRSSLRSFDIVDLHERNADGVILTSHDSGVVVRRQSPDDGGFEIVRRRNAGLLDLRSLIVLPVVVGREGGAMALGTFPLREGPIARINILEEAELFPLMKPPIITLSPVSTKPRVLIFARRELTFFWMS